MFFTLRYFKFSSKRTYSLSRRPLIRAIREYEKKQWDNNFLDATDLSIALSSTRDPRAGAHYHCAATTRGLVDANVYVGTCLVNMYIKVNEIVNARRVFDEMPVKNVVTWTTIIAGFAKDSNLEACFELSNRMRVSGSSPNSFTFATLLCVSSSAGAVSQGKTVHCQAIRAGFERHIHVSNALISMYSKCGSLKDAVLVFDDQGTEKDNVSWNSMIAAYARHGLASRAIETFERMDLSPDPITFLHVLSSCRHVTGLGARARAIFDSMADPGLEHYSCLIDLLAREGSLEEAIQVIETMPFAPNSVIWSSVMSACRLHGDVQRGIEAAERRLALDPGCAATYVQLASLCAGAGQWDKAALTRRSMRDGGVKITSSGFSWVEVKNVVHRFRAEDRSNARIVNIVVVLDSLLQHTRNSFGSDWENEMSLLQC